MRKFMLLLGLVFTLNLNAQDIIVSQDITFDTSQDFNDFISGNVVLFEGSVDITTNTPTSITPTNTCVGFKSSFSSPSLLTINGSNTYGFSGIELDVITNIVFGTSNIVEYETDEICNVSLPVEVLDFSWNKYKESLSLQVTDEYDIEKYMFTIYNEDLNEVAYVEFPAKETSAEQYRIYEALVNIPDCKEGLYYAKAFKMEQSVMEYELIWTLSFVIK